LKTLIFKHKINNDDFLKEYIKQYNICFRKVFNNLELIKDPIFINEILDKIKSKKLYEYLCKDCLSFYKKYNSSKEKIKEKIIDLENKEYKLTLKEFKKLQKLKKSFKSKIVFGGRSNLQRRSKGLITKEKWKELREYPIYFIGESSRNGNRFFDFKNISKGEIIFKPESFKEKIVLNISKNKHKKEILLLRELSKNKEISITVKLNSKNIYISFDESIMYNSNFDYKLFQKDKPNDLNKEETKEYWKSKYKSHEDYLKVNKLERYLSVDLNPNKIGYSIVDSEMNIIEKGCLEIEGKISQDKRKYELSQCIKYLFKKIEHYKVSYFVMEDLDIKPKNYGNRNSNRLIKNEWCKNYLFELINRRCNETKTILRKVNPVYSSFIGNIIYKEYDPISASLEINRRGINQYKKGSSIFPEFFINNIITDLIDDDMSLYEISSWKKLYNFLKSRNQSVRVKNKSLSANLFSSNSNVCLYC